MIRFLQKPGPVKKIILGGILIVICVMMIITLVPGGLFGDYLGGGLTTQGVLAKVGDQEVTVPQVAQQARLIGKQRFQGNVPPQLMPYLMQQAAQSMITSKAITFEADRMGLAVSDEELRDYLHQGQLGQLLFPNGNFIGQQAYEQFIENQFNISVQEFEQEVKAEIAQHKLIAAIGGAVTVSDKEITSQLQSQDTKIKFDYAILTLDDIKKQINPTDAELKAFYDKNKQMYVNSIPEKIDAKYILIDTKKLAETITITPDELQKYYSQHQDDYRLPETVTVRHILIKTPTPTQTARWIRRQSTRLALRPTISRSSCRVVRTLPTWRKSIRKTRAAPRTAAYCLRSLVDAPYRNSSKLLSTRPLGRPTGVIRTSYGFHIITCGSKQQARLKPLEEVKGEIEPILKQQKAAAQSQSVANTIQTLARTEGMDKAAKDKNLTVTSTGLITQTDQLPGIGSAPDFTSALFGAKKNDPPATAPTPVGYAVYQVTDIQPAQTPTFDQIKAKIEEQFKDERAQGMLAQKTQELSDRAHSEHDLAKAAKEVGASVKTSDLVDKNSQVPDIGAMTGPVSVAFRLKSGDISGPIQAGSNGVVLKITEVQQPSPEQMKQDWEKAKEALVDQKREEYENLYVENLRNALEKQGKIKINKKEMERLATLSEGS